MARRGLLSATQLVPKDVLVHLKQPLGFPMGSLGSLKSLLPLLTFLSQTIDFLVRAIFQVADVRLLTVAFGGRGLLMLGQLGTHPL